MLSSYDEQHTHAAVRIQVADGVATVRLAGSIHKAHWVHHFLPFAAKREIRAGRGIAADIIRHNPTAVIIRGYSLGGAIGHVVAATLNKQGVTCRLETYGTKRPPRGYNYAPATNLKNRGDWVTLLPPFRARIKTTLTDKPWRPIWRAHADY